MDNYIVSARKYRPDTFDTVVGQHALTTTLKNAIASGKLAHAYLFCGPRGVGKTTCARIFAKTINCLHPKENGEACGECESCKAFNEGRSYNIHEFDAASNNSVEDIRSLIEQVMMPPQVGRYKVFIIDEVHMLSSQAFNAFLKTLEEPPSHAIFILATTEKHKILPTILSRCQIYDFNRMEVTDIVNHLKHVAEKEGIEYEEEALGIIAHKADGGMRDAMSIFDQVVSYSNGHITYKKVIEDLNVLDYDYYFKITDQLLKPDIPAAMLTLNDILSKGFDGNLFVNGLATHFRDLLVSHDEQTLPLLEVAASVRERYKEQAARCQPKFLFHALRLCNRCDLSYRTSSNKRLLVELTLIEIAQGDDDESCGLGPMKRLKPLFKKQQAATKPAAPQTATSAAVSANTATTQTIPHTPQTAVESQQIQQQVQQPAAHQMPPMPKAQNQPTSARPIVTLSIRPEHYRQQQNVQATKQVASPVQSTGIEECQPFDMSDLSYQWYRYALSLPKEQAALAGRMKNIEPAIADNWTIDIPVENEQVIRFMNPIKESLTKHLQTSLHNSHITLNYRLIKHAEERKAYTRKEVLESMMKRSPALVNLIREFNLALT